MGKRLYVGNLPYDMAEDQVQALFAECGQVVSTKLIMDRDTGQPKGFAFVEMSTDAEAAAAIQKLNGSAAGTRKMIVSEARPQEKRPGSGGGFRRE